MNIPTIFDACVPRQDILEGAITESDFAADLARVLKGNASRLYQDPAVFFANTHPTRGLKNLLRNVFGQLARNNQSVSPIFRLDTNYGGGKTHALIALAHEAGGMRGVTDNAEFIDPCLVPREKIRVAAFDGENADPANGRLLGEGIRAYTPWGELAYNLAGAAGYEFVRKSDESQVAPGAQTIAELIGDEPVLILMDELSIYLRKALASQKSGAAEQLTAFLTALFKAVENSPAAALVYTLAIGKNDGRAVDAYARENERLAAIMGELESVSSRKATLLDPTEEDETVQVLRRRLFAEIDEEKARHIVDAYIRLWNNASEKLASDSQQPGTREKFYLGYPLHPELMDTLTEKTSTIGNFQRVRGMLRILARLVERLWSKRPAQTYALHLNHIDPSFSPIRQEILTRWGQAPFAAALKADIAAVESDAPSLAEQLDADNYIGLPPYAQSAARTIILHSLAFNDDLKGATELQLRYSILAPGLDVACIDDAIRKFRQESAYLADNMNRPLRFLTEANLNQLVRQRERQIDPQDVRRQLNDKIREIFKGDVFKLTPFPALPNDIEDSDEKPALAVIGYEATAVSTGNASVQLPDLVYRLFRYKNSDGIKRINLNNLLFIVADNARVEDMKARMRSRLALLDLQNPDAQQGLTDYQKSSLRERCERSKQELALAIQQCYRHIFYPSKNRLEGAQADLNHAVIEVQTASSTPGVGQRQVIDVLSSIKFRRHGADPDSPAFITAHSRLKNGETTTRQLWEDYRQNPALAILEDEDILKRGIRLGIQRKEFIYRKGELIYGKDDPYADIEISPDAQVFTLNKAIDLHI